MRCNNGLIYAGAGINELWHSLALAAAIDTLCEVVFAPDRSSLLLLLHAV